VKKLEQKSARGKRNVFAAATPERINPKIKIRKLQDLARVARDLAQARPSREPDFELNCCN